MSQQTNAGFNAPGFSVVADDPSGVGPCGNPSRSRISGRILSTSRGTSPDIASATCSMLIADMLSCRSIDDTLVRCADARGVGQSAMTCAQRSGDFPRSTSVRAPSGVRIDLSALAVGVGQSVAFQTARPSSPLIATFGQYAPSFQSRAVGVGHKPQPLASVGGIDGTSRDNGRPAGVADTFQVIKHSVEPVLANRRRNLLSHEDSGPSGTNESKKVGPQVPIVSLRFALAGDRERLARRGAGPELAIVGPAGQASGEGPAPDSGEKMTLPKLSQISRGDTRNASFIHFSVRNQTCGNQIA
jgi:hypothetical protein